MQITNNPAMQKPNPKCTRCNRKTFKQIDGRRYIEIGGKRNDCYLCPACLKRVEDCICEDWVE